VVNGINGRNGAGLTDVRVLRCGNNHKEARMLGLFKDRQLYVELRPQCPKCKKEFMLDLKKFIPGRAHSCFACGTVVQFDSVLAEKAQKLVHELEATIQEIYESLSPRKGGG
jgi:hypothetical protein